MGEFNNEGTISVERISVKNGKKDMKCHEDGGQSPWAFKYRSKVPTVPRKPKKVESTRKNEKFSCLISLKRRTRQHVSSDKRYECCGDAYLKRGT